MKIYFCGSVTGGRDDNGFYFKIIQLLKEYGDVLTEHIGDKDLSVMGEPLPPEEVYSRDINRVKESDAVVAEVTTPSFGVGIEIARATEFKKKVICIYRKTEGRRLSFMVMGCPGVDSFEYENLNDLRIIFDKNLK